MALLFAPLAIWAAMGHGKLWSWADPAVAQASPAIAAKAAWLNGPFFALRCVVYFGIWTLLGRWLHKNSVAQDTARDAAPILALELRAAPAMVLFALSTWVIEPLTNLLLRFNRYGRYLLDKEQKLSSTLTGLSVLIGTASACAWIITDEERWIAPGLFGLLMMVPLASMFRKDRNGRNARVIAAIALAVLGSAGSVMALGSGEAFNIPIAVFAVCAILYQWIVALLPSR